MAPFKALGGWLDGSGWTESLVQEAVAKASHTTRTRHAPQTTAAAVFVLQKHAYDEYANATAPDVIFLPLMLGVLLAWGRES